MIELNKKRINRCAEEHCPSVNENYINNRKKSSAKLFRFILLIALISLIILNFIPKVYAIGISPARTTIDYTTEEKTYSFSVLNTEKEKMDIMIVTRGDLADYVILSSKYDTLQANEDSKKYSFTLKLPEGLSPGQHAGEIRVVTSPSKTDSGTSINSRIALVHQVYVNVPYPGKFIDAELKIVSAGETTKFFIEIKNRGKEKINKANAGIDIYLAGEKIDTIKTNEITVGPGESKELYAEWKPSRIGEYTAEANLEYDGAQKLIEKNFEVGETLINIDDIVVNNFKLGDVAKFELKLNNKWSEDVKDVYVKMEFYKDNQKIAEAKTPTKDIKAGVTEDFTAFFDTAGINEGDYNVKIILNYNGKTAERETTAQITDNSLVVFGFSGVSGKTNWMMIGIIIGIILVVGNVAWFIFLRKKFFKKKK